MKVFIGVNQNQFTIEETFGRIDRSNMADPAVDGVMDISEGFEERPP